VSVLLYPIYFIAGSGSGYFIGTHR